MLSIVAGSDTTSVALSRYAESSPHLLATSKSLNIMNRSFVFFLLSNPDVYRRVQAEVDAVYSDGESLLDTSKHAELHFLTACL